MKGTTARRKSHRDFFFSFHWTSEKKREQKSDSFVLFQPIVGLWLTSDPGAESDSRPRVHAIGQGGGGGQGEDLLLGELRGGRVLGGQDVLDLR